MIKKAIFAAGCFWGVEEEFRKIKGVVSTEAGYSGGWLENPTYKDVCTGKTGHAESVLVEYDTDKVGYSELLSVFWSIHDPTTMNRQGPDIGAQYRSAIFFFDSEQEAEAKGSKEELEKTNRFGSPIVTEIRPAGDFFRAEEYHQKYLEKRGLSSCHI